MLTDLAPLSSFRRGTAVLSSAQTATIPHRIEALGGMLLDLVDACDAADGSDENRREVFAIITTRIAWRGNLGGEVWREVEDALGDACNLICDGKYAEAKARAQFVVRWIERGEVTLR